MKKTIILLLTFLVTLCGNAQQETQQYKPAELYLAIDCGNSERISTIERAVKANVKSSEATFSRIVESGPSTAQLNFERSAAKKLYEMRLRFDKNGERRITLNGEVFESNAKKEGEKAFIDRRLRSFKVRTVSRALEGLKLLGTDTSIALLKLKSTEREFELRTYVLELLD